MVKARGVVKIDSGETVIVVETEDSMVMGVIDKVKKLLDHEFEYCFEMDHWQSVEITLTRS